MRRFSEWLNSTWPHPGHRIVNQGLPAVTSALFAACYDKVPEDSDLVRDCCGYMRLCLPRLAPLRALRLAPAGRGCVLAVWRCILLVLFCQNADSLYRARARRWFWTLRSTTGTCRPTAGTSWGTRSTAARAAALSSCCESRLSCRASRRWRCCSSSHGMPRGTRSRWAVRMGGGQAGGGAERWGGEQVGRHAGTFVTRSRHLVQQRGHELLHLQGFPQPAELAVQRATCPCPAHL